MKKLHMEEELMLSVAIVEKSLETQMTWESIEKNANNHICESKFSLGVSFKFTRWRLIKI